MQEKIKLIIDEEEATAEHGEKSRMASCPQGHSVFQLVEQ